MSRTRRYAALMCSLSVLVIVLASTAPANATLRICQEECDALYAAGMAFCPSEPDPSGCEAAILAEFNSCSMGAYGCGIGYQCTIYCGYNGGFLCQDWYGCAPS